MKTAFITFMMLLVGVTNSWAEEAQLVDEQQPEVGVSKLALNFQQAPVQEIIQAVFREILNEPIVIDADLSQVPPITIDLPTVGKEELRDATVNILKNNGLVVNREHGVNVINAGATAADQSGLNSTVYIYKAKYRPLSELSAFMQQSGAGVQVNVQPDLAIIRGTPEQVAIARYVVDQYDRPLSELLLKISVIEYSSTDEAGFNFASVISMLSGKLNISLGSVTALRDQVSFKTARYEAILSAIATDSNFSVLDTTQIRVASGKTARLSVGQEVPVLNQFTTTQTGQVQQSVTYRPAGLLVDIKPVLINQTVHATVSQQLSSFAVTQTSRIDSPTLFKRELLTDIAPMLGETIIMGGLDEIKDNDARSTFLGIPLGKQESASKSTLLMLVQFSLK